jgi:hypothetical protein
LLRAAVARIGCCTSLLYGAMVAIENAVKSVLTYDLIREPAASH